MINTMSLTVEASANNVHAAASANPGFTTIIADGRGCEVAVTTDDGAARDLRDELLKLFPLTSDDLGALSDDQARDLRDALNQMHNPDDDLI